MSCPHALILLLSLLYQFHSRLTQGIESRSLLQRGIRIARAMLQMLRIRIAT